MKPVLTAQQREKQEEFRNFARTGLNAGEGFPRENLRRAARRGYLGLAVPGEWGGQGEDFLTYILLIEEVSRVCASTGVIMAVHTSVGTFPLLYHGSAGQKRAFLPALAAGEMLGAFALTEAGAGSDAAALKAAAERVYGGYCLNGCKLFITSGGEADLYTLFATVDSSAGRDGITAFLVEKGQPGLTAGPPEKKMGLERSPTTELRMEELFVPLSKRLGKEGGGFAIAMSLLDGGRIGIAAQALGIAGAAIDCAAAHLREAGPGRSPLEQGMTFRLADLATRLEAARLLTYRAAEARGRGARCTREASMAKYFAADLAVDAAAGCLDLCGPHVHGGEDAPARYFCDAKATQIYEGTNQVQRLVVARELLKMF